MKCQRLQGLPFTFVPPCISIHPHWDTCVQGPETTTWTYLSHVSHNTSAVSLFTIPRMAGSGRVCGWVTATIHWAARASDRIYNAAEMSVEVALEYFKMLFKCQLYLQIWHFSRPPAFLLGYALLLLQLNSFNYEFLCLLYPFNYLVSHLSCWIFLYAPREQLYTVTTAQEAWPDSHLQAGHPTKRICKKLFASRAEISVLMFPLQRKDTAMRGQCTWEHHYIKTTWLALSLIVWATSTGTNFWPGEKLDPTGGFTGDSAPSISIFRPSKSPLDSGNACTTVTITAVKDCEALMLLMGGEIILFYTASQNPGLHYSLLLNSVMLGHLGPHVGSKRWELQMVEHLIQIIQTKTSLVPVTYVPWLTLQHMGEQNLFWSSTSLIFAYMSVFLKRLCWELWTD